MNIAVTAHVVDATAINWPTSDTLASNATDISTSNGPGIITAVTVKKMEKHKAPISKGGPVILAGSDAMAAIQPPQFNTLTW
jgi:malic enzyme